MAKNDFRKKLSGDRGRLPSMDVSRERDKSYHYDYAMALLERYGSYSHYHQVRAAEAYDAFNNKMGVGAYEGQFKQYDVDINQLMGGDGPKEAGQIPYVWTRLGQIRAKVGVLEGDLIRRGFRPQVRAINQDAIRRKAEMRYKLKALSAFKPYARELDEVLGEGPLAEPANVPDTQAEVEEFINKKYQDQAAVVIQAILVYSIRYYRYIEIRLQLFLDAVITGSCHAGVEVRNGYPHFKYCNPLRVITDTHGEQDHRDQDSCFLITDYADPVDVAEEFGLSMEELQEVYNKWQEGTANWKGIPFGKRSVYDPFVEQGNSTRVLVVRAQWIDRKEIYAKIVKDKYGNEHVQTTYGEKEDKPSLTSKEKRDGGVIEKRLVKCVRQAVVVAGDMLVDWGETYNQIRRIDNPTDTELSYCSLYPYTMNGENVSLVQMISPLYALKEFFMTKIQLEVAKSGGRGISIDASQLPPEWGDSQSAIPIALYYLKGTGVHIRSGSSTDPGGEPPVSDFDMSVGNAIEAYLRLMEALDAEAGEMIGVTPTRQGEIVSANQLSGVTAQANAQASLVTLGMYERFKQFEERLMGKFAETAKICWSMNPERFRAAIGDVNFEWLVKNVDIDLQDYGVFVYAEPIDKQKLEMFVQAAISAGMPAHVGLKVLQLAEEDTQAAIDFFYKQEEGRQQMLGQQAQQVEQLRGQNQQAKSQLDLQKAVEPAKIKAEADLEKADRDNKAMLLKQQMQNAAAAREASRGTAVEVFKQGMESLRKQYDAQQKAQAPQSE